MSCAKRYGSWRIWNWAGTGWKDKSKKESIAARLFRLPKNTGRNCARNSKKKKQSAGKKPHETTERPKARLDAKRHWRYIDQYNPEAAEKFLSALEFAYEQIQSQPGIGHQESFRRQVGIRSWRVQGFENYLVFYRILEDNVEVLRILHGAQNLPRFFRTRI